MVIAIWQCKTEGLVFSCRVSPLPATTRWYSAIHWAKHVNRVLRQLREEGLKGVVPIHDLGRFRKNSLAFKGAP
jgi:hypothetical protein